MGTDKSMNQQDQQEQAVEFTSQSPDIPQNVEFTAAPQLEEQIEESQDSSDYETQDR